MPIQQNICPAEGVEHNQYSGEGSLCWLGITVRVLIVTVISVTELTVTVIIVRVTIELFSSHLLFVAFISKLAVWAYAKFCQYSCLTKRFSSIMLTYSVYVSACLADYVLSGFFPLF